MSAANAVWTKLHKAEVAIDAALALHKPTASTIEWRYEECESPHCAESCLGHLAPACDYDGCRVETEDGDLALVQYPCETARALGVDA